MGVESWNGEKEDEIQSLGARALLHIPSRTELKEMHVQMESFFLYYSE
jgi:hypothetical protein